VDIAPPSGTGSRVQELGDRLVVRFRPRRSWGQLTFLVIWLAGWSFGGILAMYAFFGAARGERAFLAVWLCGWIYGEVSAALAIAWQLAGREVLAVDVQQLELRQEIGRLSRTQRVDTVSIDNVEAARVPTDEDERPREDFCLRVRRGDKTLKVGEGMGEREAEYLASVVLAKIRPRETWVGSFGRSVQAPPNRSPEPPRRRMKSKLLIATALVLVLGLMVILVPGRDRHAARSPTTAPSVEPSAERPAQPYPRPTDFANPRDYAAALTLFSLRGSRTTAFGIPDCGANVTWGAWTCTVVARSTIGPFAGEVMTYRCSAVESGTLCGPKDPPPLGGAGGS
jgi:hypothetical protein